MGNPCPTLSHICSIMGILDLGEFLKGISRNLRSLGNGTGGPTLWGLASFLAGVSLLSITISVASWGAGATSCNTQPPRLAVQCSGLAVLGTTRSDLETPGLPSLHPEMPGGPHDAEDSLVPWNSQGCCFGRWKGQWSVSTGPGYQWREAVTSHASSGNPKVGITLLVLPSHRCEVPGQVLRYLIVLTFMRRERHNRTVCDMMVADNGPENM